MKRVYTQLILLAALILPELAMAKSAYWSVEPAYSEIEALAPGVFKVRKNYMTGIVDANGKQVIAMTSDSITPFIDGQALMVSPDRDDRSKLLAIIHSDLSVTPVREEVWVDDYPFFSEGLLPVCNKNGFYGYMDPQGNMVLPCSYVNIHPFSDGYAAVTKRSSNTIMQHVNKVADKLMEKVKLKIKVTYIDRYGKSLNFPKRVGDISMGTTFRDGRALVENKKGEYYFVSNRGTLISPANNPQYILDEYYAITDDNSDFDPEHKPTPTPGISVFESGDLYGYRTAEGTLLPAQFSDADPFVGDYATACIDGKWGILKLVDGNFSLAAASAAKTSTRKGKKGKAATPAASGKINVTTPAGWDGGSLTLSDGSKKGTLESSNGNNQVYALSTAAGQKVKLSAGNLILWEGNLGTTAKAETTVAEAPQTTNARVRISISPASAKADIKDQAAITVTLSNPNSEPVTTTVKVSGNGLVPVNRKVTIPAGGAKRVSTCFTKVLSNETRTVAVTADGRSSSKNVKLSPFYVKF